MGNRARQTARRWAGTSASKGSAEVRKETRDWLSQADADMRASHLLLDGEEFSGAMFHARQAVEAFLKACHYHLAEEEPPRQHGLLALARPVFGEVPSEVADALSALDPYYTQTRYPNAVGESPPEYYGRRDAERALANAEEAVAWLKERIREKR